MTHEDARLEHCERLYKGIPRTGTVERFPWYGLFTAPYVLAVWAWCAFRDRHGVN